MLVTMGVPTNAPPDAAPEAIRAVNDGMFRVTKQVQTALKWYGKAATTTSSHKQEVSTQSTAMKQTQTFSTSIV
jgi:hypothetical protein